EIHHAPAALLLHDRERGPQTADVAHELELKTLLPGVLVQALEHAAGRGSGVVHEDVDPSEVLRGAVHEALGVLAVGEVGRDREHRMAGLAAGLLGRRLEHVLAARTDRHVRALAAQHARDTLPIAATSSCHPRYFGV